MQEKKHNLIIKMSFKSNYNTENFCILPNIIQANQILCLKHTPLCSCTCTITTFFLFFRFKKK